MFVVAVHNQQVIIFYSLFIFGGKTMETKEQRIRRKFRKVINTSPEFLNLDRKKMLDLLCDWFKKYQREITQTELNELINECKRG